MRRGLALILLWLGFHATPGLATVYELPENGSAVFGEDLHVKTKYEDTLLDIARRYSLGYEEIIRANPGVDMWLPGDGTEILLPGRRILPPGPREGIVVNLPEHRLYYYPTPKKGEKPVVITFPVSIGKMDWRTPLGETRVIAKIPHPSWYPPESIRKEHAERGDPLPKVVKPGPDNPLGDYAMRLAAGDGTYMIHGTNNPLAVGMAITHGCIRMYPEDVAALFPLIRTGTKVWLINEPVKVAYVDGELFLEAHPPVDAEGQSTEPDLQLLSQLLDKALGNSTAAIHWDFARETLQAATGIPVVVGLQAELDDLAAPQTAAAKPTPEAAAQAAEVKPQAVTNASARSGTASIPEGAISDVLVPPAPPTAPTPAASAAANPAPAMPVSASAPIASTAPSRSPAAAPARGDAHRDGAH